MCLVYRSAKLLGKAEIRIQIRLQAFDQLRQNNVKFTGDANMKRLPQFLRQPHFYVNLNN